MYHYLIMRVYISIVVLTLTAHFVQLILYFVDFKYEAHLMDEERPPNLDRNLLIVTSLLRLLKIPRAYKLINTSIAFQNFWEKQNVPRATLILFMLKLVIATHWLACFWSFIAFIQSLSFGDSLREEANWISYWYESSYIEGGINPIGWNNNIDRYALSLFWSIQTITSIGYGNIVPVTRAEYYLTNILMLVR